MSQNPRLELPASFVAELQRARLHEVVEYWDEVQQVFGDAGRAALGRCDRYYLLVRLLHRHDAIHPWLYARCREVEANPDGMLDLWAREHYKSTIITFAGIVQEIVRDPEITCVIFSHTKPVARKFFQQIKLELETNEELQRVYPDVLYTDPKKESPRWSEEKGIVVKRESNPKEATLEAFGLVDGQPTGGHWRLRVYDDTVTQESVNTPEQVAKTTAAWELSDNLGARDDDGNGGRAWHVGTRYSFMDTYQAIIDRNALKVRLHPATDNGTADGKPVLFSEALWAQKKLTQGPATIACHGAGTTVLMADWTYKAIEDVQVGDEVVGYEFGDKTRMVPTRVIATNVREAEAVRYTLASGKQTICTPDHKWWAQRSGKDGHKRYAALGSGRKGDLKRLYRVTQDHEPSSDPRWQYLAGILDGEGTVSGNRIVITQSREHNPEVHARIAQTLRELGIEFSTYERAAHESHDKKSKGSTLFLLNGGRHLRHRVLLNARPAKTKAIVQSLYGTIGGKCGAVEDRVVSHEALGVRPVYNIQTVTGNYIANGYASKNCQMLQNPAAGKQAMFSRDWLSFMEIRPATLNVYIMVDPAHSRKKDSDNTAISVVGVDAAMGFWLLDGMRHKMGLRQRWLNLQALRRKWMRMPGVQMVKCGYERYGMQADLEYFELEMQKAGDVFVIEELNWVSEGSQSKDDRVQRLQPHFMQKRFHIPRLNVRKIPLLDGNGQPVKHADGTEVLVDSPFETKAQQAVRAAGQPFRIFTPVMQKDEEGNLYSLNKGFLDEYLTYPFSAKKDFIDATSRIFDMDPLAPMLVDEAALEPEVYADGT